MSTTGLPFSAINKVDNLEARVEVLVKYIKSEENLVTVIIDEPLAIEDDKKKKQIYDAFLQNPHLKEIIIGMEESDGDKRFSVDRSIALWISQALCEVKNIQSLWIECVDFDNEVAAVLSRALRRNRTLERFLLVSGGGAFNIVVQAIAHSLRFRTSLKTLSIKFCALSEATFAAIAEALQLVHSSLETLNLCTKESQPAQIAANILNAIATNKTLKVAHLAEFDADTDNVIGAAISRLLSENTALQTLSICGPLFSDLELESNGDDAIDATSFVSSLAANQSLREFGLCCWGIGDDGIRSVCEAVTENTNIVCLNLYKNNFGVEGMKAIKNLLSRESALTLLDLARNRINDDGVSYICEPLKTNDTLETLDLSGNNFGDRGIRTVIDAVKVNSTITKVLLDSVDTALEDELHYYLELNKGARRLLSASPPLPLSLWPHAFKKADDCRQTSSDRTRAPDMLYHLVKARAELFIGIPVSRKRKRR